MRIDRTHRTWFWSTLALLTACVLAALRPLLTHRALVGGNALGLTYGTIGLAFMIVAGLLGLRKRFPIWRVGRAQTWMRAHLWLGFASFPIILFHAGFRFGGTLTSVLMWLFAIVFASGLFGAALQHYLPRIETTSVPYETIYEQIGSIRQQLAVEAGKIVDEICTTLQGELSRVTAEQRATAAVAGTDWNIQVEVALQSDPIRSARLRDLFAGRLEPYLLHPRDTRSEFADPMRSRRFFAEERSALPQPLQQKIDILEEIVDEKRQLDRQVLLHRIMHGWLLLHIPLSYAVLALAFIHVFSALRY
jgi:hypothetical protein